MLRFRVPRRRFRFAFRCLALALMAVVAGDLLDAACDPLPTWTDTTTVEAGSGGDADACSDICVADCYCCNAGDGPTVIAAADPLDFLQMTPLSVARRRPSPTSAPPDQPPTRL